MIHIDDFLALKGCHSITTSSKDDLQVIVDCLASKGYSLGKPHFYLAHMSGRYVALRFNKNCTTSYNSYAYHGHTEHPFETINFGSPEPTKPFILYTLKGN